MGALPPTWSSLRHRRHLISLQLESLSRSSSLSIAPGKNPLLSSSAPTSSATVLSRSPSPGALPLSFLLGIEPPWKTVFRARHSTLANWVRGDYRVKQTSLIMTPPPPHPTNTSAPFTPLAIGPVSLILSIRTPFVPPDPVNATWNAPAVVWQGGNGAFVGALEHIGGVVTAAIFDSADSPLDPETPLGVAFAAAFSSSNHPMLFHTGTQNQNGRLAPPRRFPATPSQPTAVKLDTAADYLVVGCLGGEVVAYHIQEQSTIQSVGQQAGAVMALSISKNASTGDAIVASAREGGHVEIWIKSRRGTSYDSDTAMGMFDLEDADEAAEDNRWNKVSDVPGIQGHVYAVHISHPYLLTASSDHLVRLHSLTSGATLSTFSHSSPAICLHAVPFPGRADLLGVSGGDDGRVACWRVVDNRIECLWMRKAHSAPLWSVRMTG
ncbi:WD40 repeat-like protein [Gonapodya prolifera JEL478]|uniref:WD40 repeat-like protein n=1 Tax=Gonapodya prolifera (strain JEL478) TaxID=1344416 RepID=A0A139AN27_GONPJ|nr:WD40 repeat-like protein [Gonapodya prolifera JEL478]|eukprot:KXS18159.1 WD40 repeat-like protein [Gonapodya prolifera JEL478]